MEDEQKTIMARAVDSVPSFAWGFCGILIVTSISLKIADIEFSDPLNTIIEAKAEQIRSETVKHCPVYPSELPDYLKRLEDVESMAHPVR